MSNVTDLHAVEDNWTLHVYGPNPDGHYIAEIRKNGDYVTLQIGESREETIDKGKEWMQFHRDKVEEVIAL